MKERITRLKSSGVVALSGYAKELGAPVCGVRLRTDLSRYDSKNRRHVYTAQYCTNLANIENPDGKMTCPYHSQAFRDEHRKGTLDMAAEAEKKSKARDDSRALSKAKRETIARRYPGMLEASDELEETERTVASPCALPRFRPRHFPTVKQLSVRGRAVNTMFANARMYLSVHVRDEATFTDERPGHWLAWGVIDQRMLKTVEVREGDMLIIDGHFETGPTNHIAIFVKPKLQWG